MQNNADKLLKPPLDCSLVVPLLTLDLAFYIFFNTCTRAQSVIFYHALVAPYSISNEVPVESEGLSFGEGVTPHSPPSSAVGFHCISLPQH